MRGLFTALAVLTTPGCYASTDCDVYAGEYVDGEGGVRR